MRYQKLKKSFLLKHVKHRYKKSFQQFWKEAREMWVASGIVRWTSFVSFLFIAGIVALPIWRIVPLAQESPFIALHYNIYLGVDRFGPLAHIFFLPALGCALLVLNLLIQALLFRRQKTLALFFAAMTPVLEFILLVAMTLIVLINV